MEKEKGIRRQDMIAVIVSAVQTAAQKSINAGQQLKIEINPKTGNLKAWALYQVVDSISDPNTEIHVSKAREVKPELKVGDVLEREINPSLLGRIAAQAARQAIQQSVKHFEKERIYEDFKGLVGDIVTGVVRRRERGDLIIDLGKTEALLPLRERPSTEDYHISDRVRCLLLAIESTPRGPEIILSRSHVRFVRRLLEIEVNEIASGLVTIEGIVREPGYRTKVMVSSKDPKVDPVGACVGTHGNRIKTIVRELNRENIDVIRYHSDIRLLIQECFKPTRLHNLVVNEQEQSLYFEVSEDEMASVIGRRGLNTKLTAKLLGWRIDIDLLQQEASSFEDKLQRAVQNWTQSCQISEALAHQLVASGFTSPHTLEGVTVHDLCEAGLEAGQAQTIIDKLQPQTPSSKD
jgi:N utilization substance protein A